MRQEGEPFSTARDRVLPAARELVADSLTILWIASFTARERRREGVPKRFDLDEQRGDLPSLWLTD
ncbi:MAG: hypothetical protein QOH46_2602 [Solirubrobacteraceae bacterium]|jgi:hypothetical protein|nr:hypothetical protein [Solirubrobacteraceae bacterium]